MERLTRALRQDLELLASFLAVLLLASGFAWLADEMGEGETGALDQRILLALRVPGHLDTPIGPAWLKFSMIDITALGGWTVLTLVTVLATAFLLLRRRVHQACLLVAAVSGGAAAAGALKAVYDRARPTVVPHLVPVDSLSFPSGHAMNSAIVYLTLAAILARSFNEWPTRAFILGTAVLATVAIGCSRVYLGVHYPSDVVAGWAIGAAWAVLAALLTDRLQRRRQVEPPGADRS